MRRTWRQRCAVSVIGEIFTRLFVSRITVSHTWHHPNPGAARNAATKNAIDYLNHEWKYKPVGYASYGGVAAGTRAVQQLKQVMTTLKMVPLFEAVNIPFVQQFLDAGKRLQPNEVMTEAAAAMLDELARLAATLRPLRIPERPEPAEPETEDIDPDSEPAR